MNLLTHKHLTRSRFSYKTFEASSRNMPANYTSKNILHIHTWLWRFIASHIFPFHISAQWTFNADFLCGSDKKYIVNEYFNVVGSGIDDVESRNIFLICFNVWERDYNFRVVPIWNRHSTIILQWEKFSNRPCDEHTWFTCRTCTYTDRY